MPGGAGNVARNIATLGAHCSLPTVTGDDAAGAELATLLQLPRLTYRAVIDHTRPTTVKSRFRRPISRYCGSIRSRHPISSSVGQELIDHATELLSEVDVVVLSDYAKGRTDPAGHLGGHRRCSGSGVPGDRGSEGQGLSQYDGASLITPNVKELF